MAPRRGRYYSPAVTANNDSAVAPSVDVIPLARGVQENGMFGNGPDTADGTLLTSEEIVIRADRSRNDERETRPALVNASAILLIFGG